MIEILEMNDEKTVGFSVDGRIEAADIERVFNAVKAAADRNGKVKMYAEVRDFNLGDVSREAWKEDIRLWLRNPGIIPQIGKAALVTDAQWIRTAFDIECALIPTLTGKGFSFDEKEEAMEWLRADQRAGSRLDITLSELAETATLKAAGGFALGLLTASLFGEKRRKSIGKAVLIGAYVVGIPLAIKVLNNNRRLLSA